jgi:lipopolysaccharide export system protein LptA
MPISNTIRVKTRGLTFLQKTGEASTAQAVEFQLPRAAGTSVGADYNSKTGVVVLNSQVHITTSSNGKAAVVEAAHATLMRASDQALLVNASVNYETEEGSSDQALVYFRKDGTTEKIDAKGHVRMKTDTGATMNAETARFCWTRRASRRRLIWGAACSSHRTAKTRPCMARLPMGRCCL